MIVAGFGFRSGATPESLRDAFTRAGGQADRFATLADKAATDAFLRFAADHPIISVNPDALHEIETLTHSNHSLAARQTGSVAEACALAAAGPGARLLAPRVNSSDRMATCALAQSMAQSAAQSTPTGDAS
ncbi:cobalamin biosynthesis protein [Primorskyibacter aestuariivivens]|uniref:cobalamin biosynthesis protein n=1 Tax=Primorskyibacter aestuariivivens TaxID=1888912 RepID=UPI002301B3E9|nr:cobalamin biosynthesis protein [Primorskyibacter aestuariivivens]MDA7428022.1 cobalamin biosynthesis protein [Primorskyibacter aestuariivivens]